MCTNLKTVPKLLWASQVVPVVKNPVSAVRDPDLISGSGRSPGEGNGNPSRYPCVENPTHRGAWLGIVHGVTKSCPHLSNQHFHTFYITNNISNFCLFAEKKFASQRNRKKEIFSIFSIVSLFFILILVLNMLFPTVIIPTISCVDFKHLMWSGRIPCLLHP